VVSSELFLSSLTGREALPFSFDLCFYNPPGNTFLVCAFNEIETD